MLHLWLLSHRPSYQQPQELLITPYPRTSRRVPPWHHTHGWPPRSPAGTTPSSAEPGGRG